MSELRIIAIASELADQVRATMVSPGYGHPVTAKVATGLGPCRHCLQPFAVGEETRLLFTLNPFDGVASIPQPGPVFLHEEACKRHEEGAEYPEGLLQLGALLDGYDAEQMIRWRELVAKGVSPETMMREMLMDPLVQYVVVRDPNAGCYRMRVERREGIDG
jgi:Protein of unknown function (DUF1203)